MQGTHSPWPPWHAEDTSTCKTSQPFGRTPKQHRAGPELPRSRMGSELSKGLLIMKPHFRCPQFWITKCRHLQLLQSQSWASLLSIPQLPCSFGPAPEGTDAVMGQRGSSDILWGMEDSHSQLHSHCCTQIQLEKAQKFLCALPEKQVPGAGQQIILCSEGSGKSHVLLSLAKSCKADFSCPLLAFRPPLRVLLMKSLTPIWEIAVFAKHALPCYQKSF